MNGLRSKPMRSTLIRTLMGAVLFGAVATAQDKMPSAAEVLRTE